MTYKLNGMIVVLGSQNDDHGRISQQGIGRLQLGSQMLQRMRKPGWMLMTSGGFGGNFNRTSTAHGKLGQRLLGRLGRKPGRFMPEIPESTNTVEEAYMLRTIVRGRKVPKLIVITSDFHKDRVKVIFDAVFRNDPVRIKYLGSNHLGRFLHADPEARARLVGHETRSVAGLKKTIAEKGYVPLTTATGDPVPLPVVKAYSPRAFMKASRLARGQSL